MAKFMRHTVVVGWFAFVVLSWGVSPAHFWLDSGELSAAGYGLGVMHPPGAPGYGLWLRLWSTLPLGSLGFRMSLASCALSAAAVAGVHRILVERGAPQWIAWGAALWVLSGATFVRNGRVVEIYALGAALSVVTLWAWSPRPAEDPGHDPAGVGRIGIGVFTAVWGAWCFGDLRLSWVVPGCVVWGVARWKDRPWARWAPLWGVAAGALVLALPLASARAPLRDWGDPDDWLRLWDHLTARSIRLAFADEILPRSIPMWWLNVRRFVAVSIEDLGPVGAVALLGSLAGLWVMRPAQRSDRIVAAVLTWMLLVQAFYAIGINPMGIEDRQTGTNIGPLAALVVGEQMRRAFAGSARLGLAVGPLAWVLIVVPAAVFGHRDPATTRSWQPHAWTRAALAQLPKDALLLTQSDDLSSGVLYAQQIEGARPDVVHLVGQHVVRSMPDVDRGDPRRLRLWEAARAVDGEAPKIEAVIGAHPGPVALEYPTQGVFAGVSFPVTSGDPPLRIRGSSRLTASVAQTLARWGADLQTDEDRERLAIALSNEARSWVLTGGDPRVAEQVLRWVLEEVKPDQAAAWVALGALRNAMGDRDGAIVATRFALDLDPGRPAALGNLALFLNQDPATRDEALKWALRAARLRPWRRDGWERLAEIYGSMGREADARAARRRLP